MNNDNTRCARGDNNDKNNVTIIKTKAAALIVCAQALGMGEDDTTRFAFKLVARMMEMPELTKDYASIENPTAFQKANEILNAEIAFITMDADALHS